MPDTNDLPDEKTITLRKPVKDGNSFVDALTLREPTAGQVNESLKAGKLGGMESDILLVSQVSGLSVPAVRQIAIRDMTEATDFLRGFMPAAPETGGT